MEVTKNKASLRSAARWGTDGLGRRVPLVILAVSNDNHSLSGRCGLFFHYQKHIVGLTRL